MASSDSNDFLRSTLAPVLIVALIVASLNYNLLKDLKQLPSPIYGGDLWSHLGSMYHIYYGGSIFESSQLIGEIPWVPWFYYLPVLALSWLSGMDPMFAVLWLNLPLIFVGCGLAFLFAKNYTKNAILLAAAALFLVSDYPIFKYTDFAFFIMLPALLISWFYYLEKKTLNSKILLVIVIALSNLTNTQLFIAQNMLFGLIVLDSLFKKYVSEKTKFDPKELLSHLSPFLQIFIAGFIISLLYWYWPLFVYKGSTPNDLQIYGWADFSQPNIQTWYPLEILKSRYPLNIDFSGSALSACVKNAPKTAENAILQFVGGISATHLHTFILTLIKIAGTVLIFQFRNKDSVHRFAFLLLIATFLGLFHHLLTYNLLHIHFAPERIFDMFQASLTIVQFAVFAEWLKGAKPLGISGQSLYLPVSILILILISLVFFDKFLSTCDNPYYQGAKNPFHPQLLDLKSWVLKNTNLNDVFISTNEDSFALNAFTGRKTLTYRRTHTSTYADINQRMLDAGVILHGTNEQTRQQLLKKYKVKYLYWSPSWLNNEFHFGQDGTIKGFFDPLMVPSKPEYKKYLETNGVQYIETTYYLDPAWQSFYPASEVLVIVPSGRSFDQPWSSEFAKYLYEAKRFDILQPDGYTNNYGIIYGVKSEPN